MRAKKNIFFWMIVFALLAFFLWIWQAPQKEFSENENRILKQFPALHFSDFLAGNFQKHLEDALQDQFPGRDYLMAWGTRFKKWSGRREIGDAYLGKNGRYFERVTDEDMNDQNYERNLARIQDLAKKYKGEIRFSALLVPSSGMIYGDELPKDAPTYDAERMMQQARDIFVDCRLVDCREGMQNAREWLASRQLSELDDNEILSEGNLYYKTDHHWTALGAWIGYQMWKRDGNIPENVDKLNKDSFENVTDSFYGTLYSRTLDPDARGDSIYLYQDVPKVKITNNNSQEGMLYDMAALDGKDKYQVYLGGNHGIVEIHGGSGKGSILLLKDSFANCFVPYLLHDYEEVILIDLRYYPGRLEDVMDEKKVDKVLILYELNNFAMDRDLTKLSMNGVK